MQKKNCGLCFSGHGVVFFKHAKSWEQKMDVHCNSSMEKANELQTSVTKYTEHMPCNNNDTTGDAYRCDNEHNRDDQTYTKTRTGADT